ncbi:hypothetical protein QO034_06385 [Sedimentitalea sp. JM2-8]|uniref:Uncharacterized protein n=1 Tax=Sedimentitalea xiamensis TaxID=3050037 RepID=A0ABT7FC89_9RHOB|nr:hypothetical protein [Sedimentitalea xiamensis]MDK3072731.1 hypothetical protein [Sedimentitalea xiamensis]
MIDHDSVLKLARCRLRPGDIAARLGMTPDQVYNSISRARSRGEDIPPFSRKTSVGRSRRLFIPTHVLDLLAPHAQARQTDMFDLAGRIIAVVAEENMIDAVLDDGGANAG